MLTAASSRRRTCTARRKPVPVQAIFDVGRQMDGYYQASRRILRSPNSMVVAGVVILSQNRGC
jgi:hypothetical protein